MEKKRIVIEIDKQGKVSVEAFGFKGKSCEKATEDIARLLGEPKEKIRKKEYYLSDVEQVRQNISNGR